MLTKDITIINRLGLHARAAAKFVGCASRFISNIDVIKETKRVSGKSILGVMMLAASKGTVLRLEVSGDDETDAMTTLTELINDRFGEAE